MEPTLNNQVYQFTDRLQLRGWPNLQARLVDIFKKAALRQLHKTKAGECLLLRIYLIGEEATELALQNELSLDRPPWLIKQMDQHLADERAHAMAFADALADRDFPVELGSEPDWLSKIKIAKWKRIALKHAPSYQHGILIPVFVVGLCAEQMATRVLERHLSVLENLPDSNEFTPLITRVLADEQRHVALCRYALACLVDEGEVEALGELFNEVRKVDRSWSVSGALGLWGASIFLRLTRSGMS